MTTAPKEGEIERILADVFSFLVEELRSALDPSYLFLDWTQGGNPHPPGQSFSLFPLYRTLTIPQT